MASKLIENYAKLIVEVGINVKKGQEVVVVSDIENPEFTYLLVETAYKAGAKKVEVEWTYQPLTRLHTEYRTKEVLEEVPEWEIEKQKHRRNTLPAMIYILSEDPDGLNGVDREKLALQTRARYKKIKPIRDEMENKYQWCIAGYPGEKWAKKVFPNLPVVEAKEELLKAILKTSHALEGDPKENWEKHNENLKKRCDYLNNLPIKTLHYTSKSGTDLTVELIDNALFMAGGEETLSGNFFNPNIPSEEVFTTPQKAGTNGIVYSSKPFSYRGEIIEDFYIKFENGRAVEWGAKKGEKLLETLINMDEGSHYLGEIALVPFNSPINNTGLLFYNTLYDENASCHLALGEGFTNTIRDFDNYSLDELHKMGVNESMVHEDFMIGTADLNITATLNTGEEIEIFSGGDWA